jgi:hypothetical protein
MRADHRVDQGCFTLISNPPGIVSKVLSGRRPPEVHTVGIQFLSSLGAVGREQLIEKLGFDLRDVVERDHIGGDVGSQRGATVSCLHVEIPRVEILHSLRGGQLGEIRRALTVRTRP